jgi:hypothetical protein
VHDQLQLGRARGVARPVQDELRGLGVEVALPERRGIERLEQLPERAELQLDPFAGAV